MTVWTSGSLLWVLLVICLTLNHLLCFLGHIAILCTLMRPFVTDGVGWSVGLSICHDCEPCKNHWTDQHAFWVVDLGGSMKACIRSGCTLAPFCEHAWIIHVQQQCSLFVKLLWPLVINAVGCYKCTGICTSSIRSVAKRYSIVTFANSSSIPYNT